MEKLTVHFRRPDDNDSTFCGAAEIGIDGWYAFYDFIPGVTLCPVCVELYCAAEVAS